MQSSETLHLPAVPGEDNVWLLKLKRLEHMSSFDASHGRGVVVGVVVVGLYAVVTGTDNMGLVAMVMDDDLSQNI